MRDWNAVAGVRVPCQYHEIIEGIECICIGGKISMDGQAHLPHETCDSTGLVLLFPKTVREPCPCPEKFLSAERRCRGCEFWGSSYAREPGLDCRSSCDICQGRGWNASRDGWAWWKAASVIGCIGLMSLKDGRTSCVINSWLPGKGGSPQIIDGDPEAAFLAALTAAVDRLEGRVWPE